MLQNSRVAVVVFIWEIKMLIQIGWRGQLSAEDFSLLTGTIKKEYSSFIRMKFENESSYTLKKMRTQYFSNGNLALSINQ